MTILYRKQNRFIFRVITCVAVVTVACHAQGSGPSASALAPAGMVEEPCPPALEISPGVRHLLVDLFIEPRKLVSADFERLTNDPQFKRFEDATRSQGLGDWAGRCRFHRADVAARSALVAPRIVFMGDSITENWDLVEPRLFNHGVLNRGISGQTSEQMLVRFSSDVVALKPKIVLILAGTNDIAGNTGPTSAEYFKNDIMAMVAIARASEIEPILCSIPPTAAFSWRPKVDPKPWIKQLNTWLRTYASNNHLRFIDYYSLLAGPSGEFRADLSNDGVHPNRSGYSLMQALVQKEIHGSDR